MISSISMCSVQTTNLHLRSRAVNESKECFGPMITNTINWNFIPRNRQTSKWLCCLLVPLFVHSGWGVGFNNSNHQGKQTENLNSYLFIFHFQRKPKKKVSSDLEFYRHFCCNFNIFPSIFTHHTNWIARCNISTRFIEN